MLLNFKTQNPSFQFSYIFSQKFQLENPLKLLEFLFANVRLNFGNLWYIVFTSSFYERKYQTVLLLKNINLLKREAKTIPQIIIYRFFKNNLRIKYRNNLQILNFLM